MDNSTLKDIHISDNPTLDDQLNRRGFAEHLVRVILAAPDDSSFRIGVYGGWGEGKTSVLLMMRELLETADCKTCFFVPWTGRNSDELLSLLLAALVNDLKLDAAKRVIKREKVLNKFSRLNDLARTGKDIHTFTKIGSAVLDRAIEYSKETLAGWKTDILLPAIKNVLAETKVVVFVDDLDRLRPELLPDLLLNLRETLDLPNLYYVLALSPDIVEEGLANIHKGWRGTSGFLEKIVEYPEYLPEPDDEQIRLFIRKQIDLNARGIAADSLSELSQLLPRNPRKLKLLLRYLNGLQPLLDRFSTSEISFQLVYLCQMLRIEFPENARKLAADEDSLTKMGMYVVNQHMNRQRESGTVQYSPQDENPEDKYAPKTEGEQRKRYNELCTAIKMGGTRGSQYSIAEVFKITENPPLVTRKEALLAWEAFYKSKGSRERQRSALSAVGYLGNAARLETTVSLILRVVELRSRFHGALVDASSQKEQFDLVEKVDICGDLIAVLLGADAMPVPVASPRNVFQPILNAQQWGEFLEMLLKYANFSEPSSIYQSLRNQEADLLRISIHKTDPEQAEALYEIVRLKIELHSRPTFRSERKAASQILDSLRHISLAVEKIVTQHAIARFSQPNGIKGLYYSNSLDRQRDIIYNPNSVFHSEGNRNILYRLATDASTSENIQLNFLEYCNSLLYSATHSTILDRTGCERLVLDKPFFINVWKAAITQPLNIRDVTSLDELKKEAINNLTLDISYFPESKWYTSALEQYHTDMRVISDSRME